MLSYGGVWGNKKTPGGSPGVLVDNKSINWINWFIGPIISIGQDIRSILGQFFSPAIVASIAEE